MADKPDETPRQEDGGAAAPAKPRKSPQAPPPKQLPPFKVILHNDDVNDTEHVVETIVMLTPLKEPEATTRMKEADKKGQSLLLTTHKERAELYQQQFASRNLTVTVEPA